MAQHVSFFSRNPWLDGDMPMHRNGERSGIGPDRSNGCWQSNIQPLKKLFWWWITSTPTVLLLYTPHFLRSVQGARWTYGDPLHAKTRKLAWYCWNWTYCSWASVYCSRGLPLETLLKRVLTGSSLPAMPEAGSNIFTRLWSFRFYKTVGKLLKTLDDEKDYHNLHRYAAQALAVDPGNGTAHYWLIYSMVKWGANELVKI